MDQSDPQAILTWPVCRGGQDRCGAPAPSLPGTFRCHNLRISSHDTEISFVARMAMFGGALTPAEITPATLRRADYTFRLSAEFSRHGDARWILCGSVVKNPG